MKIVIFLLAGMLITPIVAQAKTPQQWADCADKVGRTIDVQEVGNIGYESEIKSKCGTRPVSTTGMAKPDGKHPHDVIQAAPWKARFQQLVGKSYANLTSALVVSSAMQRQGDWLVGSGYDPRGAGSSKAVIAINTKTGKVMAAYSDTEDGVKFFGFDENTKGVPSKFSQWVAESAAG